MLHESDHRTGGVHDHKTGLHGSYVCCDRFMSLEGSRNNVLAKHRMCLLWDTVWLSNRNELTPSGNDISAEVRVSRCDEQSVSCTNLASTLKTHCSHLTARNHSYPVSFSMHLVTCTVL